MIASEIGQCQTRLGFSHYEIVLEIFHGKKNSSWEPTSLLMMSPSSNIHNTKELFLSKKRMRNLKSRLWVSLPSASSVQGTMSHPNMRIVSQTGKNSKHEPVVASSLLQKRLPSLKLVCSSSGTHPKHH